eukprot:31316-Pelagococcus_subviridis.AAC.20
MHGASASGSRRYPSGANIDCAHGKNASLDPGSNPVPCGISRLGFASSIDNGMYCGTPETCPVMTISTTWFVFEKSSHLLVAFVGFVVPPLERAPVVTARVSVVIRAPDVARVSEKFNQSEIIRGRDDLTVERPAARVDVRPVRRGREPNLFAPGDLPVQKLVIAAVRLQKSTIFAPVDVRDVAAVPFAHARALVPARGVVHVDEVIVRPHGEPTAVRGELHVGNFLSSVLLRDDFVPRRRLEHDEPAAEKTRGDVLPVRGVRRAARFTADVPHRDLPALVHVVHPQRLIVPRGDKLRQKRMRRESPELGRVHSLRLVDRPGVALRDDPPVHLPRVLRAQVELENLGPARANEQLRPFHADALHARRSAVVATQRLPLQIRDRLHDFRHVDREDFLDVLREEVHLAVLTACYDVIVRDEHVVYRALVHGVVALNALLAAVRPLIDDAALRTRQRASVAVERDRERRADLSDSTVHAVLPDEVPALHDPELQVLHAAGD